MQLNERVVLNLNRGHRALLESDERLYVLGEDITDPYGGAFGVTRGLSSAFPDRVIATPISENAMIGVANGLALCGNRVIAEIMFGDFMGLAFDQLLNFTSKAVTMYGSFVPMPVIVRCPVGGNRGYGPTHSQSPQKHFMGIPNLSLYEASPFHDAGRMFAGIFATERPAIVFEPKALYPERVYRQGLIDDLFSYEFLPGTEWVHAFPGEGQGPDVALFAAGGMVRQALEAGRTLAEQDGIRLHILVPSRLYPLSISPLLKLLAGMAAVCVAEESSAGGTWGNEVARQVHDVMWGELPHPVMTISSRDSVIPAAPHLERKVLAGADAIRSAVRKLNLRDAKPAPREQGTRVTVTVPKFNSNDGEYLLIDWLVPDQGRVQAGDVLAEVETSKAVQEVVATESGVLVHGHAPGMACRPGETIAWLVPEGTIVRPSTVKPGVALGEPQASPAGAGLTRKLSRNQLFVSEAVSASHREIPDAFVVVRAEIDPVLRVRAESGGLGPGAGLMETLVMVVASLVEEHPTCFGGLLDGQTARLPDGAHVGITMDAGNGLFVPVVRFAERIRTEEVADRVAGFKVQALRGSFTEDDLADPNIVISWNYETSVSLVKAVIPRGAACVLSVGGPRQELYLGESGQLLDRTVVNLGLTHDHRVVNGREAVAFLREVAGVLGDEQRLARLSISEG